MASRCTRKYDFFSSPFGAIPFEVCPIILPVLKLSRMNWSERPIMFPASFGLNHSCPSGKSEEKCSLGSMPCSFFISVLPPYLSTAAVCRNAYFRLYCPYQIIFIEIYIVLVHFKKLTIINNYLIMST